MSEDDFDKFDFENIFGDNKKKISRKMIKSMGFLMKIQMMIIKFQQKINRLQSPLDAIQKIAKRYFFDNSYQTKQKPSQEYQNKQIFNNFKKSSSQLEQIKEQGAFLCNDYQIKVNLDLNQFHLFQKHPDENLTQIDEFQLSRKIKMFQRGMHVSSDEEEDFQNVIDDTELRHKHTQNNGKGQHLKQLEKQISQQKKTFQKSSYIFQATHKKHQKNQKTEKELGQTGGGLGENEQGRFEPVEAVKKNAMGNIQVEFEEVVEIEQEEDVTPKMTKQQKKLEKMWKKRIYVKKSIEPIIKKDEILNLDPKSILQNIENGLRPIQNIGKTDYSQPEYKEMKYDLLLSKQAKDYLNLVQQIKLKVYKMLLNIHMKLMIQKIIYNNLKKNKLENQFLQFKLLMFKKYQTKSTYQDGLGRPLENTKDYLLVPEFQRIKNCCIQSKIVSYITRVNA